VSAPWRTVAADAEDAEDERRGTEDGPLLSLQTRFSAPSPADAQPV